MILGKKRGSNCSLFFCCYRFNLATTLFGRGIPLFGLGGCRLLRYWCRFCFRFGRFFLPLTVGHFLYPRWVKFRLSGFVLKSEQKAL